MNNMIEDTDSKETLTIAPGLDISFRDRKSNVTYAKYRETGDLDLGFEARSLENVLKFEMELESGELAEAVKEILQLIIETLEAHKERSSELPQLPPLYAQKEDDGSVLLEWIGDDFRAGIGIGPLLAKSSWYVVTSKKLGLENASGLIHPDYLKATIFSLVDFVLSHS